MARTTASGSRRRGCLPLVLVLGLVLIAGLVVGDRWAVGQAERLVADNLRTRTALSTTPDVTIHGVPFLTQLATSRFDRVDLDGRGVPAGTPEQPLLVDRLVLHLHDVVTAENYSRITAGRLDGTAFVTWAEIGNQFGAQVVPEDGGRIRIDLSAGVYGQQVPIAVSARPELDEQAQRVRFTEPRASIADYRIPDAVVQRVADESVSPVELSLPLNLRAESLTVREHHLELDIAGNSVQIL